jgi:hypothetical protein
MQKRPEYEAVSTPVCRGFGEVKTRSKEMFAEEMRTLHDATRIAGRPLPSWADIVRAKSTHLCDGAVMSSYPTGHYAKQIRRPAFARYGLASHRARAGQSAGG